MNRALIFLIVLSGLGYGCASPPHQELEAARVAIAKAYASGAAELAPGRYQSAQEVLDNGEALMARGQYQLARETLPYAEALARQAIHAAREEQVRRDTENRLKQKKLDFLKQQLQEEDKRKIKPDPPPHIHTRPAPFKAKAKAKSQTKPSETPPTPPPGETPPEPVTTYTVGDGETLWIIAAKKSVYQDAFLWPLLYRANRDQIKDPRQIYAGQTLNIPRNLSDGEISEAQATARKSDIFPLDSLMKITPGNGH